MMTKAYKKYLANHDRREYFKKYYRKVTKNNQKTMMRRRAYSREYELAKNIWNKNHPRKKFRIPRKVAARKEAGVKKLKIVNFDKYTKEIKIKIPRPQIEELNMLWNKYHDYAGMANHLNVSIKKIEEWLGAEKNMSHPRYTGSYNR